MSSRYTQAISVVTTLMNNFNNITFEVTEYSSAKHSTVFRIVIKQFIEGREPHNIIINCSEYYDDLDDNCFAVWSDQINSWTNYNDYNDVYFTDSNKMMTYIFNILNTYAEM